MMEFCKPKEFQIILATSIDNYQSFTLAELMPHGFGPANIGEI